MPDKSDLRREVQSKMADLIHVYLGYRELFEEGKIDENEFMELVETIYEDMYQFVLLAVTHTLSDLKDELDSSKAKRKGLFGRNVKS